MFFYDTPLIRPAVPPSLPPSDRRAKACLEAYVGGGVYCQRGEQLGGGHWGGWFDEGRGAGADKEGAAVLGMYVFSPFSNFLVFWYAEVTGLA